MIGNGHRGGKYLNFKASILRCIAAMSVIMVLFAAVALAVAKNRYDAFISRTSEWPDSRLLEEGDRLLASRKGGPATITSQDLFAFYPILM